MRRAIVDRHLRDLLDIRCQPVHICLNGVVVVGMEDTERDGVVENVPIRILSSGCLL